MLKVTLKLYPAEWQALVSLCPVFEEMAGLEVKYWAVENIILAEFRHRISPLQVLQWQSRRSNKAFTYKLPLSVAHTLWSEMQHCQLNVTEQLLLNKLDKAITDFALPLL